MRRFRDSLRNKTYYEMLDVPTHVPALTIRRRFHNLVSQYGLSDRNSTGTEEDFQLKMLRQEVYEQLDGAFRTLLDEQRREDYDEFLADEERKRKNQESQRRQRTTSQTRRTIVEKPAPSQMRKTGGFTAGLKGSGGGQGRVAHLMKEAREAFKAKDYAGAKDLARQASNLEPQDAEIHAFLGECYFNIAGRINEAETQARQALNHDPNCVQAHILMGKLHMLENQIIPAELDFNKALKLDPGNEEAKAQLRHLRRHR